MAEFKTDKKHDFDLEIVLDAFRQCLDHNGQLSIDEYLRAFHELCSSARYVKFFLVSRDGTASMVDSISELYALKTDDVLAWDGRFFRLTGKLFSFVARDLENKMKPIETRRKSATLGAHYVTLQSMVQYEMQQGIVGVRGHLPAGTRQFLRLHRALEFILQFMHELRHSDEHAKTSQIASEVYSYTLSKHHPWITRQLAAVAVYMLPSKKFLIDVMCKQDYDKVHDLIDDVTAEGQPIYDVTQKLYQDNNLLHIP